MRIENLSEHAEFIPQLAHWHQEGLHHYNPARTVEQRIERLSRHLGPESIPVTFVAISDGQPLGSASLVTEDLPTRQDLSPWLASVCVSPQHRGQGIGGALVRRVTEEAEQLSFPKLYLFTIDGEQFYQRLGWTTLEHTVDTHGTAIALMLLKLGSRE